MGPIPFPEDSTLFYGRERERRELLDLLIAERIVVLYSPSGAGKTSLIQAALLPELGKTEGFEVLPIARLNAEVSHQAPLLINYNRYVYSALLSFEKATSASYTSTEKLVSMDLSQYMSMKYEDKSKDIVLIFDQLEEVLYLDPTDIHVKDEFFRQIGKFLRKSNIWALFSIREDYVAGLDPYIRYIPTQLTSRYRLELLKVPEAIEAIWKPADPYFDVEAAKKLANNLAQVQVMDREGKLELRPGPYVEPVQLQVVCESIWKKRPSDQYRVMPQDISEGLTVNEALVQYYNMGLIEIVQEIHGEHDEMKEKVIREWIDRQLITGERFRRLSSENEALAFGIEMQTINSLQQKYLIRREERYGSNWLELAHDRLVKPIFDSNRAWREERFSPWERRASLWHETDRANDSLLLSGKELERAIEWGKGQGNYVLQPPTSEFLIASQIARRQRISRNIVYGALLFSMFLLIVYYSNSKTVARENVARVVQGLSFQSETLSSDPHQFVVSSLLAAHAYKLNKSNKGGWLVKVDHALRSLFSKKTLYPSRALRVNGESVHSIAFSPDGKYLVSGGEQSAIRLWNIENIWSPERPTIEPTLVKLGDPSANIVSVGVVAFSPDGKWLVAGSDDAKIRLWKLTGTSSEPIDIGDRGDRAASITVMSFSPNGAYLATGDSDRTVCLQDMRNPNDRCSVDRQLPHNGGITALTFNQDGTKLATGSRDQRIRLWDMKNFSLTSELDIGGVVKSLAFVRKDLLAASLEGGQEIIYWDIGSLKSSKGQKLSDLGHTLAFDQTTTSLASGSDKGTILLWDSASPTAKNRPLFGFEGGVEGLAFSPGGRTLAAISGTGTIQLWDLSHPISDPIFLRNSTEAVTTVSFSPDGKVLASGTGRDSIRFWNLENPTVPPNMKIAKARVQAFTFNPDKTKLEIAAAGPEFPPVIQIWNLKDPQSKPKELRPRDPKLLHEDTINTLAFSSNGITIASAAGLGDRTVRLWNTKQPNDPPQTFMVFPDAVNALSFFPSGKQLVVGGNDSVLQIWNLHDSNPISSSQKLQFNKAIFGLAVSPDGTTIALDLAGSGPDNLILYNLSNPSTQTIKLEDSRGINALAFSPDGKVLAGGNVDGTIGLWHSTQELYSLICQIVVRNLTTEEWKEHVGLGGPRDTCENL